MNVILLSHDLMLLARTQGAANKVGVELRNASNQVQASEWVADPDCCGMVIDLRTPGLEIDDFVKEVHKTRSAGFAIAACGPHVHEESLNAAREAGCDVVVTRGQFEREAEVLLASILGH